MSKKGYLGIILFSLLLLFRVVNSQETKIISWSNDGNQILLLTNVANGGELLSVTSGKDSLISDKVEQVVLSPDATKVIYRVGRKGGIWLINVDGTGNKQLTTDDGGYISWLPDGTKIAYFTGTFSEEGLEINVIRLDLTTGTKTKLWTKFYPAPKP